MYFFVSNTYGKISKFDIVVRVFALNTGQVGWYTRQIYTVTATDFVLPNFGFSVFVRIYETRL